MSWIAARAAGDLRMASRPLTAGAPILRGSLAAEIGSAMDEDAPLIFVRDADRGLMLAIQRGTDGAITLLHRSGDTRVALSVAAGDAPGRLTYVWDAPAGRSLLSYETQDGKIRQQAGPMPPALTECMVRSLLERDGTGHPALVWWSVVAGRLPVGPGPLLAPQALVETDRGKVPAAALRRGDLVRTADRGLQPVLWSAPVAAPALGSHRGVRFLAPFFGPGDDLIVHPSAHVLIATPEVEYLFGDTEILVEARHLVNGRTVLREEADPGCVWQGILLERRCLIRAEDCLVLSVGAGALARSPEIAATTALGLLAATTGLPVHGRPSQRIAAPYEAAALAQAMMRRITPVAA